MMRRVRPIDGPPRRWAGSAQAVPVAGGPCSEDRCALVCRWDRADAWYERSVSRGRGGHQVDSHGPCDCPHHDGRAP